MVSNRLLGKTAFITGAGQGIGRAVALAYAREGARVIASDMNAEGLATLSSVEGIETTLLNVTEQHGIARCAQAFPEVNVLVNCSGIVRNGDVLACTADDWDASFAVNAKAIYQMIQAFLPGMLAQQQGSIINIASVVSSIKGAVNRFAYGASKGAVLGITKSVAIDYIGQGIRCNSICPGTIDSPSLHDRLQSSGNYEQALQDFKNRQPMKRLGSVDEIAAVATTLASEETAFMTGTEVIIDGGWSL